MWCHHQWHHCIPWGKMIKMRCNRTFWSCDTIGTSINIMWCWWHHQWQSHFWGQDIQNEVQCNFILVMWCHWHWLWSYMMPMVPSVAESHSLDQDNQTEKQHDFFGHVMPLSPPLHYAHTIISDITAFLWWRWAKRGSTWHFWSCKNIGASTGIIWSQWCHQHCQYIS